MSDYVIERAREICQKYPDMKFPKDIEKVAITEGCELISWPLIPPVKEVKRGRYIGIATDLNLNERRYLIAHALSHHLLHCGNQLSFHGLKKVILRKQERQADKCAAHILIPEDELAKVEFLPQWELSEHFGVPEELVQRRLTEFASEKELDRWHSDASPGLSNNR